MKKAEIFVHGVSAGIFEEIEKGNLYRFSYRDVYTGPPVSLTMPISSRVYEYKEFPPFFDGLLPEGVMLESLLRLKKIDRSDHFSQLLAVGEDMVGAVTVREAE